MALQEHKIQPHVVRSVGLTHQAFCLERGEPPEPD